MTLLPWLPAILKDLLRHVPALLFRLVDWGSMSRELATLSGRAVSRKGVAEVKAAWQAQLPPTLAFREDVLPVKPTELAPVARRELGDAILLFCFRQVLGQGKPLFLDLRLNHFGRREGGWAFAPSGLWATFTPDFAAGLSDLYHGFYFGDDARFRRGLKATGLMGEAWPEADRERMEQLFRRQFGGSREGEMTFRLSEFHSAFHDVFEFLVEKSMRLTPDFLTLGVLLVTLYASLEELGERHDVAALFRAAASP